ncbi:hypothetical protein RB195_004205 [Necator americanus]|uniref:Uncharacterized protein n=1 Tax=Necator americanus TaxID=51031 RepID=A0ABR1BH35_NECAM
MKPHEHLRSTNSSTLGDEGPGWHYCGFELPTVPVAAEPLTDCSRTKKKEKCAVRPEHCNIYCREQIRSKMLRWSSLRRKQHRQLMGELVEGKNRSRLWRIEGFGGSQAQRRLRKR